MQASLGLIAPAWTLGLFCRVFVGGGGGGGWLGFTGLGFFLGCRV